MQTTLPSHHYDQERGADQLGRSADRMIRHEVEDCGRGVEPAEDLSNGI